MGGHTGRGGGQTEGGGETVISFGTYDICIGINGGLKSTMRGVDQANLDLELFQETNVMDRIHMRTPEGYHVLVADAKSRHHGGADVFYQYTPTFKSIHSS